MNSGDSLADVHPHAPESSAPPEADYNPAAAKSQDVVHENSPDIPADGADIDIRPDFSSQRFPIARVVFGGLLLILAVYLPLLIAPYSGWDDDMTVGAIAGRFNPPIFDSLRFFWTEPYMDLYVPVTYTLWLFVAFLTQPHGQLTPPVAYHALNLLLHAGSMLTAFLLFRRLLANKVPSGPTFWPAGIGAILFAVHPVQVETVAWISGGKDLLMGLLCLLTLLILTLDAPQAATPRVAGQQPQKPLGLRPVASRLGWLALACVVYAAALLSKPTALVLPVIVLAMDRFALRLSWLATATRVLALTALAVPVAYIARKVQPATDLEQVSVWLRPLVAGDAVTWYFGKLLLPVDLAFDYGRTPRYILEHGLIWWTWTAAGILLLAWLLAARRRPILLLAGAMFLLPLGPVSGIVRFDFQAFSTVTDHYLYLPMAGIGLLVAVLLHHRGKANLSIAMVILLGLAGLSFAQSLRWTSKDAFARHNLEVNPEGVTSLTILALGASRRDDFDLAKQLLDQALRMDQSNAIAWNALSDLHLRRAHQAKDAGDLDQWRQQLRQAAAMSARAVRFGLSDPRMRVNLAYIYWEQGRLDEAMTQFQFARKHFPWITDPSNKDLAILATQIKSETAKRDGSTEMPDAPLPADATSD